MGEIKKKCKLCQKIRISGEHDPCWGRLPGVKAACCGHGERGFILLENGKLIVFERLFGVKDV